METNKIDESKSERIKWLDMVRGIAILLVVLCHCVQGVYDFTVDDIVFAPLGKQLFVFLLMTIGRLAVPLFFFLTGYLLLDKNYSDKEARDFWKNKWLALVICTEIWFAIYDVLLFSLGYEEFDIVEIVEDLLFFRAISMTHVWYLPVIIGIYLLLPLVSNAFMSFEVKTIIKPLIICTFFSFAFPLVQLIEAVHKDLDLSLQFSLGFCGGAYGMYVIMGYLVKKNVFKQWSNWLLLSIVTVSIALCVALQLYCYHNNHKYDLWYNCVFLFCGSLCLFELFSRIKKVCFYPIFKFLAHYSFAIYLVHNIYRSLMVEKIVSLNIGEGLQLIVLYFATLLITIITVLLIERIPIIGKKMLYMR